MSAEIYSAGKNDECYTPAIGVMPLLKYMDRNKLFRNHDLQLLMFEERMNFKGKDSKITFSSSYFCRDFLDKQIVMDSLKNYERVCNLFQPTKDLVGIQV